MDFEQIKSIFEASNLSVVSPDSEQFTIFPNKGCMVYVCREGEKELLSLLHENLYITAHLKDVKYVKILDDLVLIKIGDIGYSTPIESGEEEVVLKSFFNSHDSTSLSETYDASNPCDNCSNKPKPGEFKACWCTLATPKIIS